MPDMLAVLLLCNQRCRVNECARGGRGCVQSRVSLRLVSKTECGSMR